MHLVAYHGGKRLRKNRRAGRQDFGLFGEYGRVALPEAAPSHIQWKGNNRTFLLPTTKHEPFGGVFQRIGPGRGDIREIWAFRRGLRIDTRLGFVRTAQGVADTWLSEELERELLAALAHNRGRS